MTNRDPHMNTAATEPTLAEQIEWLEAHFEAQATIWKLRECDRYHSILSTLRALRDAKPALEAGANCIEAFMLRNNDVEVPTVDFRINGMNYAATLRALIAAIGEWK
jgi:hypothetical protein